MNSIHKLSPWPESWEHQEFWCNSCDQKVVKSYDRHTGNFYQVFGQEFMPTTKTMKIGNKARISDNYTSVVFALCNSCQKA